MGIKIMLRRGYAYMALLSIMIAGSCSQLDENEFRAEGPGKQKVIVEATFGDYVETKTSFQGTDYKTIFWSPGDEINLFYGSMTRSKFTSTMTEPSSSASFEGYLGAATGSSEQGISAQTFWGVYPYDEDNTCDGEGVTLKIKGVQTSSPNSFGEGMNPSVANSPGLSLSFYNVGSWFVFSVIESGITSVCLSGNNGEDIAGKVYVTMDSSGKPASQVVEGEGLKTITAIPEVGSAFIPNTEYCITVIPQVLTKGFTFTMYKGDEVAVRKTSKPITFTRSANARRIELDDGLPWKTIYVDMGNGVKWATMNVGAGSPEGYGDYFSWGETSAKSSYNQSDYLFLGTDGYTKYNATDGLTMLEPEDDAATSNWGGEWRMPSSEDWTWLKDNCDWISDTVEGVNGVTVTSRINGNSIFLPVGGAYIFGNSLQMKGDIGWYWSSSIDGAKPFQITIPKSTGLPEISNENDHRYYGMSVRPVKGVSASSREYVELGPGVKWATMNIGASSPEEYGDYFAWGETYPKSEYSFSNYAFGTDQSLTKYVCDTDYGTVDGRITLLPEDDAAAANWGGDWRMPTLKEWNWLWLNCNRESTTVNGVSGTRFTSKIEGYTDKSIFIPDAGRYSGSTFASYSQYWTSSLYYIGRSSAASFGMPNGNGPDSRCVGRPVRAIYKPRVALESFDIYESSLTLGVELKKLLSTNYSPEDATEWGAIWTSSNESVAKVSGCGEVTGVSPGTAIITATTVDGGFTSSCTVTVIPSYVDMGGGMEWALFNLGAESPEEAGVYFAWGETYSKSSYTWGNYTLGREDNLWYYNSTDGLVTLLPARDAATAHMGGLWHIPSMDEWSWLKENCTWTWKSDYQSTGVAGYEVKSNETGGIIFLPAVGRLYDDQTNPETDAGYYWESGLYPSTNMNYNTAARMYFTNGYFDPDTSEPRYHGCSIRPVRRKWVDMGNGLKWATTNVGGFNPEDYGDYFAWGETKPKDSYTWNNYKWGKSPSLTKYVTDETYGTVDMRTRLVAFRDGTDDAARANWGATWRMPTKEEWTWLRDNCTWQKAYVPGDGSEVFIGYNVTAANGNSLFFPAAGMWSSSGKSLQGVAGLYWSSTLYDDNNTIAWSVYFRSNYSAPLIYRNDSHRSAGYSVRPVSD